MTTTRVSFAEDLPSFDVIFPGVLGLVLLISVFLPWVRVPIFSGGFSAFALSQELGATGLSLGVGVLVVAFIDQRSIKGICCAVVGGLSLLAFFVEFNTLNQGALQEEINKLLLSLMGPGAYIYLLASILLFIYGIWRIYLVLEQAQKELK